MMRAGVMCAIRKAKLNVAKIYIVHTASRRNIRSMMRAGTSHRVIEGVLPRYSIYKPPN